MQHTDSRIREANRKGGVAQSETVLPANWPEACAAFARKHHWQSVRVLTLPTSALVRGDFSTAREVSANLLLDNVAAVAAVPLPNIDVRVSDDGRHRVQRVERPKAMAVEKDAAGNVLGLRIDDTDGVTTLVQVADLLPPDRRVDGDTSAAGHRHH